MITKSYISDLLIDAIGITLINSIWQGLVVMLFLSFLLYVIPKNRVQLKYWLSVTALTAMLFWTGYTFIKQVFPITQASALTNSALLGVNLSDAHMTISELGAVTSVKNLLNLIVMEMQPHLGTIVIIWLVGVSLFLIRLQGSIFYLRRLQSIGTQPVPLVWQGKIEDLSNKLGIMKKVRAFESSLAGIPMVIGHLKPVILLPAGMLTGLSPKEIEAILAHELAHIKRFDYLINIVQTVVESLLFFNPAVWWISHEIRKHREHCCDDVAVQYCGDQLEYANALSNLGAWSLKTPTLGMGLFKNKNELLMRIKRLVYPQAGSRTLKEKLIPGAVLMLTVLCLTWYSHRVQAQLVPVQIPKSLDKPIPPSIDAVADTIPEVPVQEALPPMEPVPGADGSWFDETDYEVDVQVHIPDFFVTPPVEKSFEEFMVMPEVEEWVDISLAVAPEIEIDLSPLIEIEVEELVNIDHLQDVMAGFQEQFNDTTRERIMEALEAQREALEEARIEQSKTLEKVREQLRETLTADRPDELTEEEWEMAKEQIARAERSVEQAMRQSEKALERALAEKEHGFRESQRIAHAHMAKNAHKTREVQRQVERVAREQARIQREVARAYGQAQRHNFGARMHSGKEAKLRRALQEDGLIDNYNSDISLLFTRNQIKINGVKLAGDVKDKYRELLDDMYGHNSTGELEFKD